MLSNHRTFFRLSNEGSFFWKKYYAQTMEAEQHILKKSSKT